MGRIRLETKVGSKRLTLDLPENVNGDPAVIHVTDEDGNHYGPEYADRAEALARVIALLATLAVLLLGCGSSIPVEGIGGTGAGGAQVVTSSASGTGGVDEVLQSVGDAECLAYETSIGPANGEIEDANGQPIYEDGALAMLRVMPPAYPWTAVSVAYELASVGFCKATDHEVVAFVGPADEAPPLHPAGATVTGVSIAGLPADSKGVKVSATLAVPVVVHAGEVLWVGVRLRVIPMGGGKRTCVYSCDDGLDVDSWFSEVNDAATVDLCPDDQCSLKEMQHSPDDVAAKNYGNDKRRFLYVVSGHP